MEGFRRAYRLPRGVWGIWRELAIAFLVVPATLIPEALATLFLVFGHSVEQWMIENSDQQLHSYVLFLWRMFRWATGLLTSIIVLAVISQGSADSGVSELDERRISHMGGGSGAGTRSGRDRGRMH